MAKQSKKTAYYGLGSKGASIFFDPQSRLKVISETVPVAYFGPKTARVKIAIQAGHIKAWDEDKAEKAIADHKKEMKAAGQDVDKPAKEGQKKVPELSEEEQAKADIVALKSKEAAEAYYVENFTVAEGDLDSFRALKLKEMKEFLSEDED